MAPPPNLVDAPEQLSARLLAKGVDPGAYTFTPDGTWVVYASKTDGMIAIRPDGSGKRVVFKPSVGWIAPARFLAVGHQHDQLFAPFG